MNKEEVEKTKQGIIIFAVGFAIVLILLIGGLTKFLNVAVEKEAENKDIKVNKQFENVDLFEWL